LPIRRLGLGEVLVRDAHARLERIELGVAEHLPPVAAENVVLRPGDLPGVGLLVGVGCQHGGSHVIGTDDTTPPAPTSRELRLTSFQPRRDDATRVERSAGVPGAGTLRQRSGIADEVRQCLDRLCADRGKQDHECQGREGREDHQQQGDERWPHMSSPFSSTSCDRDAADGKRKGQTNA